MIYNIKKGSSRRFFRGVTYLLSWSLLSTAVMAVDVPPLDIHEMRHDGLERQYRYYVPPTVTKKPSLVIALHGSKSDGEKMRMATAYGFDVHAHEHGFISVYPDGFENHWNDCRKEAAYSARTQGIDDVGFLKALIDRLSSQYDADKQRVFIVGFSNGAQMALRMALETPDTVAAFAMISANLPVPKNMDCSEARQFVPLLLMNGTQDPINPYHGGRVTIFGSGNRGRVTSTEQTMKYFSNLGGATQKDTHLLEKNSDSLWAQRSVILREEMLLGMQYEIHGGGHTIPNQYFDYPLRMGKTLRKFDATEHIWDFFEALQEPWPMDLK